MRYFPVFADLQNADVLVVGGSEQAAQKVRLLQKTSAHISVVTEDANAELRGLAATGAIRLIARELSGSDLDGVRLAYAATGDRQRDEAISALAWSRGIPVNVVDAPELSTFITPAIVDRDPVVVAIGTEGAAPVLARDLKSKLEILLPSRLGVLAVWAQGLRELVHSKIGDNGVRRRLWERLLLGPFRHAVLSGNDAKANRILASELQSVGTSARGRSRLADTEGRASAAGGRRAGGRSPGKSGDPRIRPSRC
jgi:uroporphyrin-III C-methyltransferase/precorrin-2 dehydrogenase/sirohydrochlorin ferrochelatase